MTIAFDVPMFVRDQLVRHKSFSFSVKSLRYSEAAPTFYVPSDARPLVQVGKALDYRREPGTDEQRQDARFIHESTARTAWDNYAYMIRTGIADEVARSVLPASLYTQLWMTGSLRSWLHFLDQRLDEHAQYEIREAALEVSGLVADNYTITSEAWHSN